MHSYLRAVGFSQYTKKKQLETLFQEIIKNPSRKSIVGEDENTFVQLETSYGEEFGLCICGEYDEDGNFDMDYYYPFFYGFGTTTYETPSIERHVARESFAGLCDDFRVGISIIFYVNNPAEYKQNHLSQTEKSPEGVVLSGLSTKGKILLPINKTIQQKEADREATWQRSQLISAAKQGDEKAIESLTLEDLDIFSMVGRRIAKEDVLSIVETYFMPRGIECDQYTILGEIEEYELKVNTLTKEEIYVITVNCNELFFDICINKMDLLGEPEVGRRIKANIWLQGTVNYL